MSKIYVSTYQKYTTGTMKGEWLDLSHYASRDDFLAACAELHSDESDPELMFQDWEEMPAQFVRESFIDEQVWAWLELSDEERETVAIYLSDVNQDATIETALGEYDGEHESEQDWARDFWDHTGMLRQIPQFAQNYIDYEQFARDCQLGGEIVFVNKGPRVRAFRRS